MDIRLFAAIDGRGILPEHTTAVALLDRLLHHAATVVTPGDSYRMKEARTRGGMPTQRA